MRFLVFGIMDKVLHFPCCSGALGLSSKIQCVFFDKGGTVTNVNGLGQGSVTTHATDPQHIIDIPGTFHFMTP